MKSTPYELTAFYLPGHAKNPIIDQKTGDAKVTPHVGIRVVQGFQFTDGAMSLRLPEIKAQRMRKFLFRFAGVSSEVLQRVAVPTRAQAYSPKSEFAGVLGLIDPSAAAPEGQSPEGSGDADPSNPNAASLEAVRSNHRGRRAASGSSVATKTTVDPAKRAALIGDEGEKAPTPPAVEGDAAGLT